MSDYLSRAAERASGTNAVIRPALPSLFGPEKNTAENVAAVPSSLESRSNVEVEHASSTGKKIAGAVSGIQERVASVLALAPEAPTVTQADKSEPAPRPTFAAVPPAQALSESEQALELSASSTESEVRSEKSSLPERSDMRPRVAHPAPVAEPSGALNESSPRSGVTRSDSGVEPSVELPSKQPEPVRAKVGEPVKNDLPSAIPVTAIPRRRPASLRLTDTRNQVRSVDRESSSDRTIHVTIGRIEVRAMQSEPAPPKPAQPRPRISLEEYLRQRNRASA